MLWRLREWLGVLWRMESGWVCGMVGSAWVRVWAGQGSGEGKGCMCVWGKRGRVVGEGE